MVMSVELMPHEFSEFYLGIEQLCDVSTVTSPQKTHPK